MLLLKVKLQQRTMIKKDNGIKENEETHSTDSTASAKDKLEESASYEDDRHSSAVDSAKDKINETKNK